MEDLSRLPVLTRKEIVENYPRGILARDRDSTNVVVKKTSGTTGKPLEVLWDNEYCDIVTALRLMNITTIGASHLDTTVDLIYAGASPMGSANVPSQAGANNPASAKMARAVKRLKKIAVGPMITPTLLSLRAKVVGFRQNVSEVVDPLMKLNATAVHSRPSYLRRLGRYLEENQKERRFEIPKIISGGEYLSRRSKRDLEGMFNANVHNAFGTQEFGPIGIECPELSGMHVNTDYFIVEFVKDDDNEPASPGEAGEVLITSLHNMLMPMIRYRIGDVAIPEDESQCSCGVHLPRIRDLQGRLDDGLVLRDSTRIPASAVVNYFDSVLGLSDYQLIQSSQDRVLINLKQESNSNGIEAAVGEFLRGLMKNEDLKVEIQFWKDTDIPPKYRPVMSRVLPS